MGNTSYAINCRKTSQKGFLKPIANESIQSEEPKSNGHQRAMQELGKGPNHSAGLKFGRYICIGHVGQPLTKHIEIALVKQHS